MKKEQRRFDPVLAVGAAAKGAAAAAVICFLLCLGGGAAMCAERIPQSASPYLAWAICAIAAAVGCGTALRKTQGGRLPISLMCACLMLLMMGAVRCISGAEGQGQWVSAAAVTGACVLAAVVGAGRKRRR